MNGSTILLIVACFSLAGCSQQPVDASGAAISKPLNQAASPSQPFDKRTIEHKFDPKMPDAKRGIVAPDMIQGPRRIVAPDMVQRIDQRPRVEDHKAP